MRAEKKGKFRTAQIDVSENVRKFLPHPCPELLHLEDFQVGVLLAVVSHLGVGPWEHSMEWAFRCSQEDMDRLAHNFRG